MSYKHNKTILALILPLLMTTGCSTETLQESASLSPGQLVPQQQTSLLMAKPIETYTFTARMVNKCWLNPVSPFIPNHVFFASAKRKGGEKAHIGIHRRAKLGRKGPASFTILFTTDGIGTSIAMQNYFFEPKMADRLKADVTRWTSGNPTCPPPASLFESASTAGIPAPIPTHKKKK